MKYVKTFETFNGIKENYEFQIDSSGSLDDIAENVMEYVEKELKYIYDKKSFEPIGATDSRGSLGSLEIECSFTMIDNDSDEKETIEVWAYQISDDEFEVDVSNI